MINRILKALFAEIVFDCAAADLKSSFHKLSLQIHPDHNSDPKAADAFIRLNQLREHAEKVISEGKWGQNVPLSPPVVITFGKSTITLKTEKIEGFICDIYETEGGDIFKIPRSPKDNDLLQSESQVLSQIWKDDKENAEKFLPECKKSVKINLKGERVCNLLSQSNGVTLREVMNKFPDGVELRHAAWMWNRVLTSLYVVHQNGFVHGSVTPENFIIEPESHRGTLIDFTAAVKAGEKAKLAPGEVEYYAPEVFKKEPLGFYSDIYSAGILMRKLLNKTKINKQLDGLLKYVTLKGVRTANIFEVQKDFKDILFNIFGPPQFVEFKI